MTRGKTWLHGKNPPSASETLILAQGSPGLLLSETDGAGWASPKDQRRAVIKPNHPKQLMKNIHQFELERNPYKSLPSDLFPLITIKAFII